MRNSEIVRCLATFQFSLRIGLLQFWDCVLPSAGKLLEPDDVTFAVLVRGYGETDPPQWAPISALLASMDARFQMKPSTGASCAIVPSV